MELDKCSALLININRVICVFKIEFPRRAYFPFLRFMNNSWVQLYKATKRGGGGGVHFKTKTKSQRK